MQGVGNPRGDNGEEGTNSEEVTRTFDIMPYGDMNDIMIGHGERTRHIANIDTVEAIRRVATNQFRADTIANTGPYRAVVLAAYGPDGPPSNIRDQYGLVDEASSRVQCPWIVARINELHAHIPDPARYNRDGTREES